jgi:hypothetical protein
MNARGYIIMVRHIITADNGLLVSQYDDTSIELVDGQLRSKKALKMLPSEQSRTHEDTLLRLLSMYRGDLNNPLSRSGRLGLALCVT